MPDGRRRRPFRARPRLALGADPRRSASGSTSGRTCARRACSTASRARSPDAARPTSTCSSCARTPRASTRASAAARTGRSPARSAIETSVFTRAGVERVRPLRVRAGRVAARRASRARRSRTPRASATCSGTRSRRRSPRSIPGVRYERVLVDALAARMVRAPDSLDVVVASNLFGGHPHRPRRGDPGRHGHGREREPRSGHRHARAVRAGARLRAGHRRPGHREPGRRDLERVADARPPRRARGRARR